MLPLLLRAAGEHRRVSGLTHDHLRLGALLLEHAPDSLERAARADPGHPIIETLTGEIVHDLARRRARVKVGVGLVLELPGEKPSVRRGELDRLPDHPRASLGRGREDDLRPQEAHQASTFDAEALGHGDHERIAVLRADNRQADTGVATRRLDHRLSRLERARPLRVLDYAKSETILDGAERVERLDFDVESDVLRGEAIDADDRGVAYGFENVCEASHRGAVWVPLQTWTAKTSDVGIQNSAKSYAKQTPNSRWLFLNSEF